MEKFTRNNTFLGASIPHELHAWVKALAEKECRNVSKQVTLLFREARAAREKK